VCAVLSRRSQSAREVAFAVFGMAILPVATDRAPGRCRIRRCLPSRPCKGEHGGDQRSSSVIQLKRLKRWASTSLSSTAGVGSPPQDALRRADSGSGGAIASFRGARGMGL
jgi:hypothetical protein